MTITKESSQWQVADFNTGRLTSRSFGLKSLAAVGAIALVMTGTVLDSRVDASTIVDVDWSLPPPAAFPDLPEFREARDDYVRSYGMTEDEAASWVA